MTNERRCPMCGRPNPADAEVCRHCGARLTLLGAGEEAGGPEVEAFGTEWFEKPETAPPERPPSTDETAWLRGFFATHAEEGAADENWALSDEDAAEALPESGELKARLDAWVRAEAEAGAEPAEPEAAAPAETDWVPPWAGAETGPTGREAQPPAEAEAEAPSSDTGWLPPWLDQETASLATDAQVPAELEPEPPSPAAPAEAEAEAEPEPAPEAAPEPPRLARQTGELALSVEEIEELLGSVDEGEPPPPPEDLLVEPETTAEEEPAPELDRAQVPEWLRQAAPVTAEPSAPSVVEEILEGPAGTGEDTAPEALVGIPDVLPAVPDVARPRVRSRAPLTLRLTRRQEQRAQWLQELLQAEKQPRTMGAPWSTLRFGWLRALVGVLLMLVVALWAAAPWPLQAAPAPHPAWQGVYAAIEALPPQAPVLLVVDGSWATAPEVRPIAQPVLTHLARKQAQVLQVSTVPWGVGVLTPPAEGGEGWQDLGYMPGGAVWMAQLVQALPYALTGGANTWPPAGTTAWQGVQQARQTALIVVVTDAPEQARLWAEQVAPALEPSSGLAFVLSAQAGPWTEPYLAAAGVRGAVIGVEGGLAYGQVLGLDMGPTQDLWSRYQAAWLLATLLLVVAGIAAGLLQRVARRERRKSQAG